MPGSTSSLTRSTSRAAVRIASTFGRGSASGRPATRRAVRAVVPRGRCTCRATRESRAPRRRHPGRCRPVRTAGTIVRTREGSSTARKASQVESGRKPGRRLRAGDQGKPAGILVAAPTPLPARRRVDGHDCVDASVPSVDGRHQSSSEQGAPQRTRERSKVADQVVRSGSRRRVAMTTPTPTRTSKETNEQPEEALAAGVRQEPPPSPSPSPSPSASSSPSPSPVGVRSVRVPDRGDRGAVDVTPLGSPWPDDRRFVALTSGASNSS